MKKVGGLILLLAITVPGHATDDNEALANLFPLRASVSAEGSGLSPEVRRRR